MDVEKGKDLDEERSLPGVRFVSAMAEIKSLGAIREKWARVTPIFPTLTNQALTSAFRRPSLVGKLFPEMSRQTGSSYARGRRRQTLRTTFRTHMTVSSPLPSAPSRAILFSSSSVEVLCISKSP
ncbi:hypothetical protein ES705_31242 [subsurface metagenome]